MTVVSKQQKTKQTITITNLEKFTKMIQQAASVACSKGIIPILSCLKLDMKGGKMVVMGGDSTKTICLGATNIATSSGDVSLAIPAKTFANLLSKLSTEEFKLEINDRIMTIRSKKAKYQISLEDVNLYPELRTESTKSIRVEISTVDLRSGLEKTLYACAVDDCLTILNGINFNMGEKGLILTSTDRFRLSSVCIPDIECNPFNTTIDENACKDIIDFLKNTNSEKVTMIITESLFTITSAGAILIASSLEGIFPDVRTLLPKEVNHKVTFNKSDVLDSLSRIILFDREREKKKARVYVDIGNDMKLSSSTQIGAALETIAIEREGEDIRLALSLPFMIDTLKHIPSDRIRMDIEGPLRAVRFLPVSDNAIDTFGLVIPMRLEEG
ncbi:DNA polymerase III subunit beta [Paenibacillus thiaminolyticus]|uniref:Beta sliding clamp n=1 Tax=Paenibacillus thiaminolyticus TaxID=49283 RepID=A0A3A3GCF9_PANTH|nr:DNA polymerase III subunit beta [Paenibacillus thiaminolyticus]RJG21360.1 DNA polymerase III subunit beta [Paenibacillus thiaminolyticus]